MPINIGLYLKDKKRRWCPTETNENSEHVANSEKWGYCSGYCPIELGKGKHWNTFLYIGIPWDQMGKPDGFGSALEWLKNSAAICLSKKFRHE